MRLGIVSFVSLVMVLMVAWWIGLSENSQDLILAPGNRTWLEKQENHGHPLRFTIDDGADFTIQFSETRPLADKERALKIRVKKNTEGDFFLECLRHDQPVSCDGLSFREVPPRKEVLWLRCEENGVTIPCDNVPLIAWHVSDNDHFTSDTATELLPGTGRKQAATIKSADSFGEDKYPSSIVPQMKHESEAVPRFPVVR